MLNDFLQDFNLVLDSVRSNYSCLPLFICGDFNCRIANLNILDPNIFSNCVSVSPDRSSLDTFICKKGKILVNFMEGNGLLVCNGRFKADTPAQFTYCGPLGKSVIDLFWCSLNGLQFLTDFEVLHVRTRSDHFPVAASFECNSNDNLNENISNVLSAKLVFEFSKSNEYSNLMRWRDEVACSYDNVDNLNDCLISSIKSVAQQLNMVRGNGSVKPFSHNNKPWFDNVCYVKRRLMLEAYHKCKI